jgi:hypothetical protein
MYGSSPGFPGPERNVFNYDKKRYVDEVVDIDRQGQTREWKGLFDHNGVDVQITCLGIVSGDLINHNVWEPRLRSYVEGEGYNGLAIYGFNDRKPNPPVKHRGLNNIGFSLVGKEISIYRPFISEEEIADSISRRLFPRFPEQVLSSWQILKYVTSLYGQQEVKLSDLGLLLSDDDEGANSSAIYEVLDFIQKNSDINVFGQIRRGYVRFNLFNAKIALYGKRFARSWEFSTIFSKLTHRVKDTFVERLGSEVVEKSESNDHILVLTDHDNRDKLLYKLSEDPRFLRTE